jgi:hypothetical protein
MAANGMINADFERYIDAWADMMITIWREKINAFDIHQTGDLARSLRAEVSRQAGGNTAKIEHFYLRYGDYVARGVGKGYARGNGGDLHFTPHRHPKPWTSGKYWSSKQKLFAEMLTQTGNVYMQTIKSALEGSA